MQTPKYKVDEIVYVFNIFKPLVAEFLINGIMRNEEGVFYTHDGKSWIREEFFYPDKREAYQALQNQISNEAFNLWGEDDLTRPIIRFGNSFEEIVPESENAI